MFDIAFTHVTDEEKKTYAAKMNETGHTKDINSGNIGYVETPFLVS
jgi:hypothetical protein